MDPKPDDSADLIYDRAVSRDSSHCNSKTSLGQLPALPTLPTTPYESSSQDVPFAGNDSTSSSPDVQKNLDHENPTSFVEFDLSAANKSQENITKQVHFPSPKENPEPALEPSVAQPAASPEVLQPVAEEDFFDPNSSGWKDMKKVADQNYYDEMGYLEFAKGEDFAFSGQDVRAYTKINTEEQLKKYANLNEKTDFLFQTRSLSEPTKDSHIEDEEEFDEEAENIESDQALSGTKSMLSDSQKFAYIGMAKLVMMDMATELATLNQRTAYKISKKLNMSQKNFANWTLYIMSKLCEHLEIQKEEKAMIENLSTHGVETVDLAQSLILIELKQIKFDEAIPGFDLRWVLICDLFLLLLSDGYYDSRSRTLLFRFSTHLGILPLEVCQFERRMIESLEMDTTNKTIENKDDKLKDRLFIEKHIQKNRKKRMAYIGLATLGGSLAIGLSAGLLAPVIAAGLTAGLTTVGIGGAGGFLAGVGGTSVITTGGIAIGSRVGNKAGSRRMGEVQTFEMKPLHNNKRSNLIITVSGWMNGEMDDVRLPFSTVDPVMGDMFSLLWEPEMLKSMGQTIGILASEALSTSIQQILGATILSTLMSAIQLPMMLSKLSYLLDNPWNVSLDRAWKAGKILADTLILGNMGVRPITLVGFSLGSRLIYSCLIELANRGGFGLVENVILLGSPVTIKYDQITLARSVVSGKFINGYIRNDWILGYLFRATGGGLLTVGGISPIENIPGIENFDCSKYVDGHMSYRKSIPKILKDLDWEVLSGEFAEIEEPDYEQKERQRKLLSEFEEARAKMESEQSTETKPKSWKDWFRPKQKNWWDVYDDAEKNERTQEKAEEFKEYNVPESYNSTGSKREESDNPTPREDIFDVGALMREVEDIERVGNEASSEALAKLRNETEEIPKAVANEDLEEEAMVEPSVLDNVKDKLGVFKKTDTTKEKEVKG